MTFLFVLGLLTLIAFIAQGIEVTLGGRKLQHLDNISPIRNEKAPRVSIIIPACNEEYGIEHALQSVLAQDYPNFEVIVVEDRSTDRTGEILDRIAAQGAQFRVLHVTELPSGWLGKNNALQQGANLATGEFLLFTDADVVMEPTVLRRAVAYVEDHDLDHLTAAPRALVPGFWSNSFLGVFALGFSLYTKPWKVRDPESKEYIGIGAFNLLRRAAYVEAGGHQPIALRPDDDVMLGKLMKQRGFRQDMVFATRLITVEWYQSFRQLQGGLMKNLFAGAKYSVALVVIAVLMQFTFLIWPFLAVLLCSGPVQWVNGLTVLAFCILFALNSRLVGIGWWWCLATPVGAAICIYLVIRSTVITLVNNGINWRGTHYPLAQLRSNKF